jgi:transposase InsO family protein
MPWRAVDIMSLRYEFVHLALKEEANLRELCRRYEISPKTGYKWLQRFLELGETGLIDQSRRPWTSPRKTSPEVEEKVLKVRDDHPAWGGRKIKRRLEMGGCRDIPSASTITKILGRNGRLEGEREAGGRPYQRFEASVPNELWQMDFKGSFAHLSGRCHPLTVVDDHSRFAVGLAACSNEQASTVRGKLTGIFNRYGLPAKIMVDNGSPWGSDSQYRHTILTVWLMGLGIKVFHSRPYHPQTMGKNERFNQTLKREVVCRRVFKDLADCQGCFDRWRKIYNFERPHEALDLKPPGSRYSPSRRSFTETPTETAYRPGDVIRKAQEGGWISYLGREYKLGRAFKGQSVALRATDTDGLMEVFFINTKIATLDLRQEDAN